MSFDTFRKKKREKAIADDAKMGNTYLGTSIKNAELGDTGDQPYKSSTAAPTVTTPKVELSTPETPTFKVEDAASVARKTSILTERKNYLMNARDNTTDKNRREEILSQLEIVNAALEDLDLDRRINEMQPNVKKDTFAGQFGANYDVGRLSQDMSLAWSEYLRDPSSENRKKAEKLAYAVKLYQATNASALDDQSQVLPWVSQSLANYLPQFFDQAKYQAGGAAAGAAVGSVVPVIGTAAGAKAGMIAGSGVYSHQTMRGAAFYNLLEMGVPEEVARQAANDEALISALIEMADTGVDILTLGFGGKLTAAVGKAATNWAGKNAAKKAALALSKYGLNIISEAAEEGSQEIVSIANQSRTGTGFGDLAGESAKLAGELLSGGDRVVGKDAYGNDLMASDQVEAAAKEGGKIAAMMFPANKVGTMVGEKVAQKVSKPTNTAKPGDQPTAPATPAAPVDTAPAQPYNEPKAAPVSAAAAPEVKQAEAQAEITRAENPGADVLSAAQTAYLEAGVVAKIPKAKRNAFVVQKLVNGETVTDEDIDKLALSTPKGREVFTKLTGVQFPTNAKLTPELLRNLARSAHTVAQEAAVQQAQVTAQQQAAAQAKADFEATMQRPAAELTPEQISERARAARMADNPAAAEQAAQTMAKALGGIGPDGKPLLTFKAFSEEFDKRNNGASPQERARMYDKYLKDNQTVLVNGQRMTRQQFEHAASLVEDEAQRPGPDEIDALWNAEVQRQIQDGKDAAEHSTRKKEANNGRQANSVYREGLSGQPGQRSGGQGGSLSGETRRAESDGRARGGSGQVRGSQAGRSIQERLFGKNQKREAVLREVKLGNTTIHEVDPSSYTPELREAADRYNGTGVNVHFVVEGYPIDSAGNFADGITVQYKDGRKDVYLQIVGGSALTERADHELVHVALFDNPKLKERAIAALADAMSEDALLALANAYMPLYGSSYGSNADLVGDILEEIIGDAYAGLNRMNAGAPKYQSIIRGVIDAQMQAYSASYGKDVTLPDAKMKFSAVALGDSDETRYQKLKNFALTPATVRADKVSEINLEAFSTTKKSDIEKPMRTLAKLLGITNIDLENSAIDFKFQFSNESLRRSLNHQLSYGGTYADYAKAMTCFEDLIKNAILIETHPDYKAGTPKADRDLKQAYVLISAMRDENAITPIEFEVKENYTRQNQLYLTVMLTKIDPEVLGERPAGVDRGMSPLFSESSDIMLADLLRYVNPADGEFLKYVPDGFLNEAQKEAKRAATDRRNAKYPPIPQASDDESGASFMPKKKFSINTDKSFSLDDYTIDDILKWSDADYDRAYHALGLDSISDDILLADDFSIDDIAEELDEEPEKIEILYRRAGLGNTHIADGNEAVMTQDRLDKRIHDSESKGNPDYARKYITRISPKDFLDLTVTEKNLPRENFDTRVLGDLGSTMGEWDYNQQLYDSKEPPVLDINRATGQVIGHNGRHRVRALEMSGIESVEIEVGLYDEDGHPIKYGAHTIPDLAISSQFDSKIETHLSNVIPLNSAHRDEILSSYTEAAKPEAAVKYSITRPDLSFADQVDLVRQNKLNEFLEPGTSGLNPDVLTTSAVYVTKEPNPLMQELGYGDLAIVTTQEHIRQMTGQREAKPATKYAEAMPFNAHNHQLSPRQVKRLPKLLEKPAAVIRDRKRPESLVFVTTEKDYKGRPIIIPVKANGVEVVYDGVTGPAHIVTSMYGRDNFEQFFEDAVKSGRLVYYNKERIDPMLTAPGYQSSGLLSGIDSDTILGEVQPKVKDPGQRKFSVDTTKYVDTDSAGQLITEEQDTYFKKSKMRDYLGRLMVMFHGTKSFGFTVFDPKFSDDGRSLFFTDRPSTSRTYTGTKENDIRALSKDSDLSVYDIDPQDIRTEDDAWTVLDKLGYKKVLPGAMNQEQLQGAIDSKAEIALEEAGLWLDAIETDITQVLSGYRLTAFLKSGAMSRLKQNIAALRESVADPEASKPGSLARGVLLGDIEALYTAEQDLIDSLDYFWEQHPNYDGVEYYEGLKDSISDPERAATQLRRLVDAISFGESAYVVFSPTEGVFHLAEGDLRNEAYQALKQAKKGLYEVYLNLENPLIIDANEANWNALDHGDLTEDGLNEGVYWEGETTREIAEFAQEAGYDGVIFRNLYDHGYYAEGDESAATIAIAFRGDQVKSTANTNPTKDPDIRYSITPAFEKWYKEQYGTDEELTNSQLKRRLQTLERRAAEAEESAKAAELKNTFDSQMDLTAWMIHHTKEMREQKRVMNEKLDAARKEKTAAVRAAVAETKELERAKAAVQHDADRMAERRNAAKRLHTQENAYTQKVEGLKENLKLKRNAARATLRNANLAAKKRAEIETEQGMVDTIRKNPKQRSYTERLQEGAQNLRTMGRSAYRTFVNQAEAIDRLSKRQISDMRAGTLVNILGGSASTVETIFKDGLVSRAGDRIGGSMKETFLCWDDAGRKVDENKQALLQDFMLHWHNIDRMSIETRAEAALETFELNNEWLRDMDSKEFARLVAMTENEAKKLGKQEAQLKALEYNRLIRAFNEAQNKPIFADSKGNSVTAETSQRIVQQYLEEAPWLMEKANGIYEWWDLFMREWAVGDTISEAEYRRMRQMYPHYAPTYRADKNGVGGAGFVGMGGASVSKAVKKAKGSHAEVLNIEDSFANMVSKIIRLNRLNELYLNIVDTAMLDDDGTFADMVAFDWDSSWQTGDYAEALKSDLEESVDDAEKAGLEKVGQDYKLTAWKDGRKYTAFISEDLYKSIGNTTGHLANDLETGLLKIGNALTGPMKTAITGINFNFALRNVSRDLPTAVVNSISGMAFPVKYWPRAAVEMAKNSDNWKHFKALGGTHSTYYNDNQGFAKAIAKGKNPVSRAVKTLGTANEATEAQTRFAEYLATIDRLGDTYEARLQGIKNAAEVTVDFSRKGRAGKVINAWVPYWNPAVQGIDKVVRSVIDSPDGSAIWKQASKTLGRAAMTTILWEAVLYAVLKKLDRDDEWEELDDRTKDTYYCIPLPAEKKFLKIPKNREWGAILGTPFMRMLEYANGRENPFENYLETAIEPNFLPPAILRPDAGGGFASDIIGVSQALDLAKNEDFAGRTIVPYAQQQGSLSQQFDADTSNWTKKLGELFNWSPMQIDYIIGDYFGDFGDLFIKATSEAHRESDQTTAEAVLELIKQPWVADARYSNQSVNKYYELMDELGRVVNDKKNQLGNEAYKETLEYQAQKAVDDLYGKTITELNKQVRGLPDGEEKDAAKEQIAQTAAAAIKYYEDIMAGSVSNPILTSEYADFSGAVSEELIRMASYSTEYRFTPTGNPSAKYTDPDDKKREYILDAEQKDYFKGLYREKYDEIFGDLINSQKYRTKSGDEKAKLLEDARNDVLDATKEEFFDWLKKSGVRSTPKKK